MLCVVSRLLLLLRTGVAVCVFTYAVESYAASRNCKKHPKLLYSGTDDAKKKKEDTSSEQKTGTGVCTDDAKAW